MPIYSKPVRLLMADMASALAPHPGAVFTRRQAIDWFSRHYPKISEGIITAHLTRLSTNTYSRMHYSPNLGEDDILFQLDFSHFRLYDPARDPPPIYAVKESGEIVWSDAAHGGASLENRRFSPSVASRRDIGTSGERRA